MLSCMRYETQQIQSGLANSVTRAYPGGCPHRPGNTLILTSKFAGGPQGQEVPFAIGTIVSVRPTTVAEMRRDNRLAQMDGFANGDAWYQHFRAALYRGGSDDMPLFRIQFRLEEMDRDVSKRMAEATAPASPAIGDDKIEVG